MSLLKRNVVANFAGRASGVAVSLLFVPVYLHFLGGEGYALIGFSLVLFALLQTLDLGLSAAFSRELARARAMGPNGVASRDLARTLEVVYWSVGLAIAALFLLCSPLVARHWLDPDGLSDQAVLDSLRLMAVALALQWPMSLYNGGLSGLERQVTLNVVLASFGLLRGAGAALVLWQLSATPQAYFAWLCACHASQTALTALLLWQALPSQPGRARFRPALLREVWRFAAGVSLIAVLGALASQIDKVLLSGLLPLEAFGYYMLAWTLSSALAYFAVPLASAVAPRFAALHARHDVPSLSDLYLRASELAAVAVVPVAAVLAAFSPLALQAWTGDSATSAAAAPLLALLLLGSALNSLLLVPFQLQLACGQVRLGISVNIAVVLLYCPMLALVVPSYGALGAAWAWLALNAAYALVVAGPMHRRVLPGIGGTWALRAVVLPALAALGTAALLASMLDPAPSRPAAVAVLALGWAMAAAAVIALTPRARTVLLGVLQGVLRRQARI